MDPNSFANVDRCSTRHLSLHLTVEFGRGILHGTATHCVRIHQSDTKEFVLDTKHLVIHRVEVANITTAEFVTVEHQLDAAHPKFGQALHVPLPTTMAADTEVLVRITYETTHQSSALQFLTPEQTAGKVHPYLFTQCQAIHARTMVPCQDSPGVKITYDAAIQAPKPLKALMSAISVGERDLTGADQGWSVFEFEQKTSMPSYLLALVVGNLQGKSVGPRSTVWTEPEVVDAAAWEFVDTEEFIATAEALLTPYQWGRYDLLVVPPSFPFGGMENPCLTFVTPTLLAGDRSLVDVVAHEISHSWTGNLVTTKNWESFWLNEGWTVFVERKILGRLHGEATRHFGAILGYKELERAVDFFGKDNPFTALIPDLKGEDPDDAFSTVPYEKGFNLLFYLENHLGGPQIFEPYMKAYIREFSGQSIDTAQWKDFLYRYMLDYHPEGTDKAKELLSQVDWDKWFYGRGMPPVIPNFDQTLLQACEELARRWNEAREHTDKLPFSPDDLADFTTDQKSVFLEIIRDFEPFPHTLIETMQDIYQLKDVRNSEIRFRWQMVCLKARYTPVFPRVVEFVLEQGRMKFVRPLYRSLHGSTPEGAKLAQDTFKQHREFYHPIAAAQLEKDLDLF
ncbi:Leucyl aminopeptidase yscIV [Dispira simplex]|nr:Leucyl aminopeptidase yscIV [Dispira simplex]